MPTFPYHYKEINFGRVFNPLILAPVRASWGWQDLWFLVDSGADTTTMPLNLAKKLGLALDDKPTKLYGIGAQALDAFSGKITIKIGNRGVEARTYFIDTDDTTLLLGRLDIFDCFTVTFDQKLKSIHFDAGK